MVALATSVALVVGAAPASATFPGTNGPVYFQSNRSDPTDNPEAENEIYRINSDGTGLLQITNNTVHDERPAVSPDGTKVAFMSFRDAETNNSGEAEIMIMNSNGSNQTFLTNNDTAVNDFNPAFTPDGTHVLYNSDSDGDADIYSVPAGGGLSSPLTSNAVSDAEPDACATNGRIVFDSTRGNGTVDDSDNDIWVMDANGANPIQLTGTSDGAPPPFSPNDFAPSWSPNCTKIVFISTRDDNQNEVYVMDANGANQTRITNTAAFENNPVWSPDGTLIAYTLNDGIVTQAPIAGQTPHTVTSVHQDSFADWAPQVATRPNTFIDSGPSGATNDPTPTFAFHSNDASASFQCKVDGGGFANCSSPKTLVHLNDGAHTLTVRAQNSAGVDTTPATRSFTVKTASVSVSGSTLAVTAAAGAKDNLAISRPSASTIRVVDSPGGAYTGSGVHVGAGCTRVGDYTANCNAAGITFLSISSGDQNDKITNSTALRSSLRGGSAADLLIGGSGADSIAGNLGADSMKGMNGNDALLAHDGVDDPVVNCDGGTAPGTSDSADADPLPKDSPVPGCETVRR